MTGCDAAENKRMLQQSSPCWELPHSLDSNQSTCLKEACTLVWEEQEDETDLKKRKLTSKEKDALVVSRDDYHSIQYECWEEKLREQNT